MSTIGRALISVTDKTGLPKLAQGLTDQGYEIISTGGTAKVIIEAGVAVTEISAVTGIPEMMGGRLKTLSHKVFGGILARPDNGQDMVDMTTHDMHRINIVVVNLYNFAQWAANPHATFSQVVEQIDIGGPSLIRAAAKNAPNRTWVVVDPIDYPEVLKRLETAASERDFRLWLMAKAFRVTSAYEAVIAEYMLRYIKETLPA